MATDNAPTVEDLAARDRRRGLLVLVLALLPALAAIWGVRWFVTQDGPAHLYNAHIIVASRDPGSPFAPYYTVRWEPLPNWGGHLVSAFFVTVLPPWAAGPAATSLTLVGFAAAVVWLRVRVAGWRGLPIASAIAVLLALNFPWLLGFTSFILGACLFPVTLGVWWAGRERLGWLRVAAIAGLTVLGYACHLVSLGLTAFGLAVLALATPGPRRGERLLRTAVGLSPLLPLALLYHTLSRRGGAMRPVWVELTKPFSPASWARQLAWVDPLTLAKKGAVPFTSIDDAPWFRPFTPLAWLLFALLLIWGASVIARSGEGTKARDSGGRAGWAWLAALLLIGGIAGPDSFGSSHGEYLSQRVVLLGLVALVPLLNLEVGGGLGKGTAVSLALALAVQSAIVWDYALTSHRMAGAIAGLRDVVGRNQRVATLLIDIRTRFRGNPLLHADNLLGIGTGNIIWSNYETQHYYFPVQFRPGLVRPNGADLESIAIEGKVPGKADPRPAMWQRIVRDHVGQIDAVVVWGSDPAIDAVSERWFETVYDDPARRVRVLRPKQTVPAAAEEAGGPGDGAASARRRGGGGAGAPP